MDDLGIFSEVVFLENELINKAKNFVKYAKDNPGAVKRDIHARTWVALYDKSMKAKDPKIRKSYAMAAKKAYDRYREVYRDTKDLEFERYYKSLGY